MSGVGWGFCTLSYGRLLVEPAFVQNSSEFSPCIACMFFHWGLN